MLSYSSLEKFCFQDSKSIHMMECVLLSDVFKKHDAIVNSIFRDIMNQFNSFVRMKLK